MTKHIVVVGIIVTADTADEATEAVAAVLEGDKASGVIADFHVDYAVVSRTDQEPA